RGGVHPRRVVRTAAAPDGNDADLRRPARLPGLKRHAPRLAVHGYIEVHRLKTQPISEGRPAAPASPTSSPPPPPCAPHAGARPPRARTAPPPQPPALRAPDPADPSDQATPDAPPQSGLPSWCRSRPHEIQ